MNDLNTILDDAGNRALVEKYLVAKFLERRDYDTVLANADFAQEFRLPEGAGQYVELTRKNHLRLPQNVDLANQTADPASGASLAVSKRRFPIEFIHEYVGVGAIAQLTSWVDLEQWAKEDMPIALRRRRHQLAQNAFLVGRYQPGKYAADGSVATAFDTTVEATVTLHGVSFTFPSAPKYYANRKPNFAAMNGDDRATFDDLERIKNAIILAGGMKINGGLVVVLSESMASDLARDDKYFNTVVNAWKGEGIRKGELVQYKGLHFYIDDEPFTENWAAENVRAANGQIHSAIITAKSAFGYLNLGSKGAPRPTFKVQDLSKTGVEKTIGYMVPNQAAIATPEWCAVYKAPVSDYTPNNS